MSREAAFKVFDLMQVDRSLSVTVNSFYLDNFELRSNGNSVSVFVVH